jgi:hypothetical protein
MAPTNPTEPGWYPDPWGTGGERRFDGTAWGRETRPAAGTPAPTGAPEPTPAGAAATGATPAAPTGDLPPAAWYPDPAGSPGLRYWDGTAWTSHTAYTEGPAAAAATVANEDPARLLASEQNLARSLRVLLLFAGPALVVQIVAGALFARDFAPFYRQILENPNGQVTIDLPNSMGLSLVSNLASMVFLATGFVFIIWLGTASKLARAKGMELRRTPWVGAWSFVIPIVNYWWPYRATKDLFAADAPELGLVRRWWTLWVATKVLQMATGWCALFGAPDAVLIGVASVTAAVALAAALAARAVVGAVGRAHADLAGVPVQA